jgi:transposase-like protein
MRNVVNTERIKLGAIKIYQASNQRKALRNYWEWAKRWRNVYPNAVKCIEKDLDELLSFLKFPKQS